VEGGQLDTQWDGSAPIRQRFRRWRRLIGTFYEAIDRQKNADQCFLAGGQTSLLMALEADRFPITEADRSSNLHELVDRKAKEGIQPVSVGRLQMFEKGVHSPYVLVGIMFESANEFRGMVRRRP